MRKLLIVIFLMFFGCLTVFNQDIQQPKQLNRVCDIKCNEDFVSWELYYNTAVHHFYNAEHELAFYNFEKALELNDKEIKIYPYLIYALYSFEGGQRGLTPAKDLRTPFYSREPYGKNKNAEKIFENYFKKGENLALEKLRNNPENDEARFYLGMLYAAAANFEYRIKGAKFKPRDCMEIAAKQFGIILKNKDSEYYYSAMAYLGGLNYMFGKVNFIWRWLIGGVPKDKNLGMKMLKESYEKDQENNEAALFLFSALYVEKKYAEAREIALKLIDKYPMNFDLKEYLVFLNIKIGRYDEARVTIDIALRDLKIMKGPRYRFFEKEFNKALVYLNKK